jgi:hypothetical protein
MIPKAAEPRGVGSDRIIASTNSLTDTRRDNDLTADEKWPIGRRLLFILGSSLIFWIALLAIIRWI